LEEEETEEGVVFPDILEFGDREGYEEEEEDGILPEDSLEAPSVKY